MRLKEYIAESKITLKSLASQAGVSYAQIKAVYAGKIMNRYDKAKAISEATKGQVRVEDLCEPPKAPKRKRPARPRAASRS